jgi:uncharacterized membrane protein
MSTRVGVGTAVAEAATRGARIVSLDVIRGAVMVLMAIDHVRVYAAVPAGGPQAAIFFTRWVTHFCAPAFIFLAGTSAFLHGRKLADTAALSRFLVVRGVWLIVLELTFLRLAWTFNLDYRHYILAGVIWVIGWCMIGLAGLVRLPIAIVTIVGAVVVAAHNLLDPVVPQLVSAAHASRLRSVWEALYLGPRSIDGTGGPFVVLYSFVPWIGVMALGYAFGAIVVGSRDERRRFCLVWGLGAIAALVVLRATGVYGDPNAWNGASWLGFLNTTKYPASLQFLLMTLGPTIALVPLLEDARGWLARVFAVFGRVPLFYYVLHIPLIHLAACVVSLVRAGRVDAWLFDNHPMMASRPPDGYMWSLSLLYAVFAIVVVTLYFPCRWYARVKAERREAWMQLL